MTTDADVVIVGAGLAGLSAAIHLHQAGVAVTICETADDVGGRVRTDRRDGFLLDRGFQVLLPAYPELRRLADLSALKPRPFLRGVVAMTPAGGSWLAGPWHGHQAVAGTTGFLLGHPRDSAAMAAMSLRDTLAPGTVLRAADPATTTMEDLRRRFSPDVIAAVLRPFLAGVFSTRPRHACRAFSPRSGGAPARRRRAARGWHADAAAAAGRRPAAGTVRTGTQVTEVTPGGVRTKAGEDPGNSGDNRD